MRIVALKQVIADKRPACLATALQQPCDEVRFCKDVKETRVACDSRAGVDYGGSTCVLRLLGRNPDARSHRERSRSSGLVALTVSASSFLLRAFDRVRSMRCHTQVRLPCRDRCTGKCRPHRCLSSLTASTLEINFDQWFGG